MTPTGDSGDFAAILGRLAELGQTLNAVIYLAKPDEERSPLFVTPAIEELLGYTVAEWLSEPLLYWKTIHPDDLERVELACRDYQTRGRPVDLRYRRLARDGRLLWFREHFTLGETAQGPQVQGVMVDASELGILEETLGVVLKARSVDETLRVFAHHLMAHLGFRWAGFLAPGRDDRSFLLRWSLDLPEVASGAALAASALGELARDAIASDEGLAYRLEPQPLAFGEEAVAAKFALALAVAWGEPAESALGDIEEGARATEARATGALIGLSETARGPVPQQLRVATSVARQAALALERAALQEQLDQASEARQALSRALLRAQEEERRRLSRTLHDLTGQLLTAALIRLDVCEQDLIVLGDGAARALGSLSGAQAIVRQSLDELRALSHDLRPLALDQLGLHKALVEMAQQLSSDTTTVTVLAGDLPRLSADSETALFRIAQAAATNAVRHAEASAVTIEARATDASARLTVSDDGRGLGASPGEGGMGLTAMRERAEELGGWFRIESGTLGTTIEAEIPRRPLEGGRT